MEYYSLFLALVWLVFILYWLISAVSAKRNVYTNYAWFFGRIVIVVIVIVLLHAQIFSSAIGDRSFLFVNPNSLNPITGLIGDILAAMGIGFAIWARVYLGKNWGMPMSVKENPELVTSGPYKYVRHPIYSGVLLAMIGSVLIEGSFWFIIIIVSGIYFIYAATREEKLKLKEFPDQYPAYKSKTKMLIPFVF